MDFFSSLDHKEGGLLKLMQELGKLQTQLDKLKPLEELAQKVDEHQRASKIKRNFEIATGLMQAVTKFHEVFNNNRKEYASGGIITNKNKNNKK